MNDARKQAIVDHLQTTRAQTLATLAEFSAKNWQNRVYSQENEHWTVLDLLRHTADAERSMTRLMQVIQQGGEGASAEFDLARWNASRVAKSQDLASAEVIERMATNRAALLTFIDSLAPADFDKKGRHGSGHILSIEQTCLLIGNHEQQHLAEMVSAEGE